MTRKRAITYVCLTTKENRYCISSGSYDGKITLETLEAGNLLDVPAAIIEVVNSVKPVKVLYGEGTYLMYKSARRSFNNHKVIGARVSEMTNAESISELIKLQDRLDSKKLILSEKIIGVFKSKFAAISIDHLSGEVENVLILIQSLSKCGLRFIPKQPIPGMYA